MKGMKGVGPTIKRTRETLFYFQWRHELLQGRHGAPATRASNAGLLSVSERQADRENDKSPPASQVACVRTRLYARMHVPREVIA
jgi:hypothetical protein